MDNLTERASVRDKKIKAILHAQNQRLVGKTFTPGFRMTAIMALATAWTPTHPFGPSHDPEAIKVSSRTREAIATAISLITKGEDS